MPLTLSRRQYADMFGPTVGDRVRLADSELFIEVERDLIAENGGYGNEVKFGGGKVIRDGMGQSSTALDADCLDLVITNALILDAVQGVIKADIGVKGGRIVGIGHAGNPGIQNGITMVIGAATEVIAGEGCILTAGCHRHPHPLHLPAADRARARERGNDHARRWHRARAWHLRDHLHSGNLEHPPDARGGGGISDESRLPWKGQLLHAGTAA